MKIPHIALDPYRASFELLVEDLRRLLQYVEPADPNLSVFSHRIYELFLRCCTEFESISKDLLVVLGSARSPADMNITDYKSLEHTCRLEGLEIGVLFWSPPTRYFQPFAHWSSAQPPLAWYSEYNKVKHNRNSEFSKANLFNLMQASCALFAMLARINAWPQNRTSGYSMGAQQVNEYFYQDQKFSIRETG